MHVTRQRHIHSLAWLIACLLWGSLAVGQPAEVPYTRNELATIAENDSLIAVHTAQGHLREACICLDNNAMLFWRHNQLQRAVDYFERSLEGNRKLDNQNGIAGINSNLAFIYADMEQYEKAYEYFELTLAVRRLSGRPESVVSALVNESVVLNQLKRYELSLSKLEEALRYTREMNDEKEMRSVYGMLCETYQKMGNVEKALYYYSYYKTFNDYVSQKQVDEAEMALERQQLAEMNLRLQNESKELELERQRFQIQTQRQHLSQMSEEQRQLLDSLSAQEMAYQLLEARSARQQLQYELLQARAKTGRYTLLAILTLGVSLIVVLAVVLAALKRARQRNVALWESNEQVRAQSIRINEQNLQLREQNNTIAQKNQEVLASIRYSKQIQDAVMCHSMSLHDLFDEAFHFDRPYAIVSGDFHYFRLMPNGHKLVVAGDCTGHGVPGAFLTILAITALDHAVFDLKLTSCCAILDALDESFSDLNAKRNVANHSMDACVCIVKEDEQEIEFAGARNGMLVVQNGESRYIKGSLSMLGQMYASYPPTPSSFHSVHIPIEPGMWCYLCSDGINDQFNEQGEKFSSRRLRQVLSANAQETGPVQYDRLVEAVVAWQGNCEQVDDMLVVGFRVGTRTAQPSDATSDTAAEKVA